MLSEQVTDLIVSISRSSNGSNAKVPASQLHLADRALRMASNEIATFAWRPMIERPQARLCNLASQAWNLVAKLEFADSIVIHSLACVKICSS